MRLVSYEILPGRVLLDVMTDDGEPVAVQLRLSAGLWAVATVEVIDRWAASSRQLATVVRCGPRGRRLVLSDGETRVMLDLLAQPDVACRAVVTSGRVLLGPPAANSISSAIQ